MRRLADDRCDDEAYHDAATALGLLSSDPPTFISEAVDCFMPAVATELRVPKTTLARCLRELWGTSEHSFPSFPYASPIFDDERGTPRPSSPPAKRRRLDLCGGGAALPLPARSAKRRGGSHGGDDGHGHPESASSTDKPSTPEPVGSSQDDSPVLLPSALRTGSTPESRPRAHAEDDYHGKYHSPDFMSDAFPLIELLPESRPRAHAGDDYHGKRTPEYDLCELFCYDDGGLDAHVLDAAAEALGAHARTTELSAADLWRI